MWNTENQPVSVGFQGTIEYYTYDADGGRIKKVRNGATTYYIGGMYEEDVTGSDTTIRTMYMFAGKVVAQRTTDSKSSTLIYLHGDHLGSVGAATGANGALVSSQEYDPWGRVRSGGVGETKYNYTGQKLDDTGLLFYNARYYDPLVGRFVSPDSIVPDTYNSRLAVDFHEATILGSMNMENRDLLSDGFWGESIHPDGPRNPQTLNRYAYVENNPILHSDPSGHAKCNTLGCGGVVENRSSKSVRVFGTYRDGSESSCTQEGVSGCTKLDDGKWAKQGWRELPKDKTSADIDIFDADMVQAMDDQNPLHGMVVDGPWAMEEGYDTRYEYKVADVERVYVRDAKISGNRTMVYPVVKTTLGQN